MLLYDKVTLDDAAKLRRTADGYLAAMPRVARTGIQLYGGDEVGKPDMRVVRVYRPESEVFHKDSLHSYAHRPVTIDHPPERVTSDNWKKYSSGQTGDEVARDNEFIRVPMVMMDREAIKAFEDGKRELSLGYTCDLKWEAGTTDGGEPYDAIQTNIRANHLAVVAAARGGPALKIGDDNKGEVQMSKTMTVDGITFDVSDIGQQVIERALKAKDAETAAEKKKREEEEEEKKKFMKKDADNVALLATKDALIVTLEQKIKDATITPDELDRRVVTRQEVIAQAKALIGDALVVTSKTEADMRRQVVATRLGDKAKDFTDEQVLASFMSYAADLKPGYQPQANGAGVHDIARGFRGHAQPIADAREQAYADYNKELEAGWQQPVAARA